MTRPSVTLLWVLWFCVQTGWAQDWKLLEPQMPVSGKPGETVLFRLRGPSQKELALQIGDSRIPLTEGATGEYRGQVSLPGKTGTVYLEEPNGLQALGALEPLPHYLTFVAHHETVTRQGPDPAYDRLTPLYRNQMVSIDGRRGRWLRCASSGTWVDARNTQDTESYGLFESPLSPNRLNRIRVDEAPSGDAILTLVMDRLGEVQVTQSRTDQLEIHLEDCLQTCFDVRRPSQVVPFLGPIVLQPLASRQAVRVSLEADAFQGYQIEPTTNPKELKIRIRKPLPQGFEGLRVTVDAGHGGPKDSGTVGHGGLKEKTLNLRVAKALAKKLRAQGAIVTMTREDDRDVSLTDRGAGSELQARIDKSMAAGSQLFLSLHHNARPVIAHGKVSHATDVYWYQAHSQSLARALADPIADAIGEKDRSFRWRSFYVCRQTHSPTVLIEFQYLSNPQLEQHVLSQDAYPDWASEGVLEGLRLYLNPKK